MTESPAEEITTGIWCWQRRPRGLRPGEFGVRTSYVVTAGGSALLIDPLVTGPDDPVLGPLDQLTAAAGPVRILVSKPFHTRSAELLWHRYRDAGARIYGHREVATRLTDTTGFQSVAVGHAGAGTAPGDVARFHPLGRPPRSEQPIHLPMTQALVFGDSVVETGGELRVWEDPLDSDRRRRWWEDKYRPTLEAVAALEPVHILVTHGAPVVGNGAAELRRALGRNPWQRPKRR